LVGSAALVVSGLPAPSLAAGGVSASGSAAPAGPADAGGAAGPADPAGAALGVPEDPADPEDPAEPVDPADSAGGLADPADPDWGVISSRVIAIPKGTTDPGEVAQSVDQAAAALGAGDEVELLENPGPEDANTVVVVEADPEISGDVLASLKASGLYEAVDFDALLEPDYSSAPNDPDFASKAQWELGPYPGVNAAAAWPLLSGAGAPRSAPVAVIDTGFLTTHPDYQGANWVAGRDYANDTEDVSPCPGYLGQPDPHGTATAGIVAAKTDNGLGIASAGWDNQVIFQRIGLYNPSGVINTCGLSVAGWVNAMYDAVDNLGARVINMSFGGSRPYDAATAAMRHASELDVVLVASAGNDGTTRRNYPASYPNVISVAATDSKGNLTEWSNRADTVLVSAPGLANHVLGLDGGTTTMSGTSFSAPTVAGVVAMIRRVNPALTAPEIAALLRSTSKGTQHVVDAKAALDRARSKTATPYLALSENFPVVGSEAQTLPVKVATNQASWSISANTGSKWLAPSVSKGASGSVVSFRLAENATGKLRAAKVTFKAGALTKVLEVTQWPVDRCAGDIITHITCEFPATDPSTSFSDQINPAADDIDYIKLVPPVDGTYEFQITSTLRDHQTLSIELYEQNGEAYDLVELGYTWSESGLMWTTALRGGKAHIMAVTSLSFSAAYTITVTRLTAPRLEWAPSGTTVQLWPSGYHYRWRAEPARTVYTNAARWEASVTDGAGWLRVTEGGRHGDVMRVWALENTSPSERSGTIVLRAGDLSAVFSVNQWGVLQDECAENAATRCEFPRADPAVFSSRLDRSDDIDWVRFTAPAAGEYNVVVEHIRGRSTCEATILDSPRNNALVWWSNFSDFWGPFRADVSFSAGGVYYVGLGGCSDDDYRVTVTHTGPLAMTLAPDGGSVPAGGGAVVSAVGVPAGRAWEASPDDAWLSVSPGAGADGGTLRVTAAANEAEVARVGHVTVRSELAPGVPQARVLTVTQAAAPVWARFNPDALAAGFQESDLYAPVDTNHVGFSPWNGVVSSASWLVVADSWVSGGGAMRLRVLENGSASPRTARVTAKVGQQSTVLTVTQAGAPVVLSRSAWAAPQKAASESFTVTAGSGSWTAASDAEWLTLSAASGKSGDSVKMTAAANRGPKRVGTVTVSAGGSSKTVSVTQEAGPAATLALSKTTLAATAGGGALTATVTTNQDSWAAVSDSAWLAVSSGGGGALGLVAALNTGPARTAVVTVTTGGPMGPLSKTLTVNQSAPAVTASPASWQAPAGGGATTLTVSTDQPGWTAASDSAWLLVAPAAGVDGERAVLTALANTGAARTGTVTITASGATRAVAVKQAAPAAASLSLSATSWDSYAGSGSTLVTLKTNLPGWSATADQPWLSVSEPSGPGNANGRAVAVGVEQNTGAARSGTVTFTAGTASKTFKVTQRAGPSYVAPSLKWWNAPSGGATITVSAETINGKTWTLKSSASWLTVSSTAAGASGATRTVTAAANTTTARRTATLTFTSNGVAKTVAVIQDTGKAVTVSKTAWAPAAAGAATTATVTTYNDAAWEASSDRDWLVIGPAGGAPGGVLNLVARPNTANTPRTATVTITSGGTTAAITVTQTG
jgi:subtilisin family serine protease